MRIALYGGSFNSPRIHHQQIVEYLSGIFDLVLVVPCGPRPDKPSCDEYLLDHRQAMVRLGFNGIPGVEFDFYDLNYGVYTPNYLLHQKYRLRYPDDDIWYVVGSDIITGGAHGESEIHKIWDEGQKLWNELQFLIIPRAGWKIRSKDVPPFSDIRSINQIISSSSTVIRRKLLEKKPIDDLVSKGVKEYIEKNHLYS